MLVVVLVVAHAPPGRCPRPPRSAGGDGGPDSECPAGPPDRVCKVALVTSSEVSSTSSSTTGKSPANSVRSARTRAGLVGGAGISAVEGDRLGRSSGLGRHGISRPPASGVHAAARPVPVQRRQSVVVRLSSSSSDAPPAAPTSLRSVTNFRPRPRHAGHGVPPPAVPAPHLPEARPARVISPMLRCWGRDALPL